MKDFFFSTSLSCADSLVQTLKISTICQKEVGKKSLNQRIHFCNTLCANSLVFFVETLWMSKFFCETRKLACKQKLHQSQNNLHGVPKHKELHTKNLP